MPYPSDEARHPHLTLIRAERTERRRTHGGGGSNPPDRGGRKTFSSQMSQQLDALEAEFVSHLPPPLSIQPHLVFKVPLAPGADSVALAKALEKVGIIVVEQIGKEAVVAFRGDADFARFRKALAELKAGPRTDPETQKPHKSLHWDVLQFIEVSGMSPWGLGDRIGSRLAELIGPLGDRIQPGDEFVLDIDFWYRSKVEADRDLKDIKSYLADCKIGNNRLCDHFVGDTLAMARVRVSGSALKILLDLDVIAEVEVPPTPVLDLTQVYQFTIADFESVPPPADGPRVCVVDSGIAAGHPLLSGHVGHEESFLTADASASDVYGHGTRVAGVAVFGNIQDAMDRHRFESPIVRLSARVLNHAGEFDDERLIVNQVGKVLRAFTAEPFNCRIFNMSLHGRGSILTNYGGRQGRWSEAIDILAKQFEVLFVVAAGNHTLAETSKPGDAEQTLQAYPQFLLEEHAGVSEPGSAAIALTVGSIAATAVPSVRRGAGKDDIIRAVAALDEPSPFTRTGPGVNGAVKPELVDYGGNLAFQGTGSQIRSIRSEPGLGVLSLYHRPLERLFTWDRGTSLAAPRVAHLAALVSARLREELQEAPHPNLIRAVIANAAAVPVAAEKLAEGTFPDQSDAVLRLLGYGLPDHDYALYSGDRRVTMVAQSEMEIDSFHIYEIPVVAEFLSAPAKKQIIISVAFDPPVRRRRARYLGVTMDFDLLRGTTVEQVLERYRWINNEERKSAPKPYDDRHRCDLKPGIQKLGDSTLLRRVWNVNRLNTLDGDTYFVVVRSKRTWAPPEVTRQRFAIAVTLVADHPQLYQSVKLRIQPRLRARQRV